MKSEELQQICSNVEEKLNFFGPNLVLSEGPAVHQKRTVTFINHFLSVMVEFLNKFSHSCESKLVSFDEKLKKIENELFLVEAKINSIPAVGEPNLVQEPIEKSSEEKESLSEHLEDPVRPETPKLIEQKDDYKEKETKDNKEESQDDVSDSVPKSEDPLIAKYRKMVQVGVPLQAVKLKMASEGLDPSLLSS